MLSPTPPQLKAKHMDQTALKTAYAKDEALQAICDHFALRSQNQKETKLSRLQILLRREGQTINRAKIIAALKKLESAQCGKYIKGSKGWPSRFEWTVSSQLAGSSAADDLVSEEDYEEMFDELDEEAIEMRDHSYQLRTDLAVTLDLPVDLTAHEAKRLAQFILSLPLTEA